MRASKTKTKKERKKERKKEKEEALIGQQLGLVWFK